MNTLAVKNSFCLCLMLVAYSSAGAYPVTVGIQGMRWTAFAVASSEGDAGPGALNENENQFFGSSFFLSWAFSLSSIRQRSRQTMSPITADEFPWRR